MRTKGFDQRVTLLGIFLIALLQTSCLDDKKDKDKGPDKSPQLACETPPTTNPVTPAITAGNNFSAALRSDGLVCTWGLNDFGQLGDGTETKRSTPATVVDLENVIAIVSGHTHMIAIKDDKTVWAWGRNNKGQLGDGTTIDRLTPVQVAGLSEVVSVSAGEAHSIALKTDGSVWAWGFNERGQLGENNFVESSIPIKVQLPLPLINAIAAGGQHNLALDDDGEIWAWGFNADGELGNGFRSSGPRFGEIIPGMVNDLTQIDALAAGNVHSMALRSDNTVWAWGDGTNGQIGDGDSGCAACDRLDPVQVIDESDETGNLRGIKGISVGFSHSLALKFDGTVWAWGKNSRNQVGDGFLGVQAEPLQRSGLSNIIGISGGGSHSLALKDDGTVWGWGDNQHGQLGLTVSLDPQVIPELITGLDLK